jgi:RNA polymerase sigma-70 factor (ECF subfamily)
MLRTEDTDSRGGTVVYCVAPASMIGGLPGPFDELRRVRSDIVLVPERRGAERRMADRRNGHGHGHARAAVANGADRRDSHDRAAGRRIGERRLDTVAVRFPAAALPSGLRAHARRLTFVTRRDRSREDREQREVAALISQYQDGHPEAFEALYRMFFPQLRQMLRAAVVDPNEAEDLAQEVLVDVLRALPRFRVDGPPFRAWLLTIARNRLITSIAKRRRAESPDSVAVARDLDRRERDDGPTELGWMAGEDFLPRIDWLPVAQRQVLLLRYHFDLAWDEIGHVLGRSPGAVRVLQTRAFELLRRRLDAEHGRMDTAVLRSPMRRLPLRMPVRRGWMPACAVL